MHDVSTCVRVCPVTTYVPLYMISVSAQGRDNDSLTLLYDSDATKTANGMFVSHELYIMSAGWHNFFLNCQNLNNA